MSANDYVKLEQRLTLAAWAAHKIGYSSNKVMLENLREIEEGFDNRGNSFLVQSIAARGAKCLVPREDLERYDANIRGHLTYFNNHRKEPLTLRYFQHLSLLLTELFLDRRFNNERALRKELNVFIDKINRSRMDIQDSKFTSDDLTKLAFWMATGSGKTILMHFHYRQFLHYSSKPIDNILLVTPDEGLSQQHLENMEASGIPCSRFSIEVSGFEAIQNNTVRVIEITKLVEEKKGSGVSVPVESFEGNNLIFVDEGHRGASSEAGKWVSYREKLAETGFTFEYSATFGQAMTTARDDALTQEYGKSILFDYSYKYFYGDGFGKDFEVLNVRKENTSAKTMTLLLANLLAFHEQKRAFQTNSDKMLHYGLADPLWIFVGSTVNKSKDNKQAKDSDVLTVIKFLDAFLRNKKGWVQKALKHIFDGKSGLEDDGGHDLFATRFKSLKAWSMDPETIYRDILKRIFQSTNSGRLYVGDIKGKPGELGLKVSGSDLYFGLVYIGDTASFKDLIEAECKDVEIEDDQIGEGLFENIKKPGSQINILIGAKKFMQGWDSWRVTNMGLLNIGRSEGSEIIQLFGRGVRLMGLNRSLKRSPMFPEIHHPAGIELLERLNIFAIRANYMAQFRDYLDREGIDPSGEVELVLPIKQHKAFLKKGLIAPRFRNEGRFAESERILLACDGAAKVVLDIAVNVDRLGSAVSGVQYSRFVGGGERRISKNRFALLDWEKLYLDILEFKEERQFHNLLVRPEHPRQILEAEEPTLYGIFCDESLLNPSSSDEATRLQDVVASVLRKYVETFYRKHQQRWESERMTYAPLKGDDDNFQNYTIKIPRGESELIKLLKEMIAEGARIYKEFCEDLPALYLDRHLYQPLLISKGSKVKTVPPSLNEGETRFVNDLVEFCKSKKGHVEGRELFLLRNLSRGKGVGFFEDNGFFPDFIFWIVQGKRQRVVFIEPHGMRMEVHPLLNKKVNLHLKLRDQFSPARKSSRLKDLELDSYIISTTPYEELREQHGPEWDQKKYASAHVLFFPEQGNLEYISNIVAG